MAETLNMTLAQNDSRGRPSKKTASIDHRWHRLARMASLHHGNMLLKTEAPEWLAWLELPEDYKPAYFKTNGSLVLGNWETTRGNPHFVKEGDLTRLVAFDKKYQAQVCPGHALINPYDDENQSPLFMDCDMPWWGEGPSPVDEIIGFCMAIYREARNMCADKEKAGEGAEPFFTSLKVSARLEGPVLSVEAWTYYGTICELNNEDTSNE